MLTIQNVSQFFTETVAPALEKAAAERHELRKKLASAEQKLAEYAYAEKLEKIAVKLEGKGQFSGLDFAERLNYVKNAAANGANLDAFEQAAEMMAPNGSFGSVSEKVASNGDPTARFQAQIMSM